LDSLKGHLVKILLRCPSKREYLHALVFLRAI